MDETSVISNQFAHFNINIIKTNRVFIMSSKCLNFKKFLKNESNLVNFEQDSSKNKNSK